MYAMQISPTDFGHAKSVPPAAAPNCPPAIFYGLSGLYPHRTSPRYLPGVQERQALARVSRDAVATAGEQHLDRQRRLVGRQLAVIRLQLDKERTALMQHSDVRASGDATATRADAGNPAGVGRHVDAPPHHARIADSPRR